MYIQDASATRLENDVKVAGWTARDLGDVGAQVVLKLVGESGLDFLPN